ncbi:MAG TPA: ABC transporter permease [Candidatus Limnocylindrales bacterium]|nr:ABC transporter permease [Candidatus Limnocylindrales bacterium]
MLDWGWIGDHLPQLAFRTAQHLELAAIALAIGFAISFAIGVAAARWRVLYPPSAAIAGIVFTIPSLALFAAFVPATGLSILTAEIPLVLYTLVILLRNVVAGFDAVPADVLEAADAMGFTRGRRLLRIELPLAVPLIVAGLRVASVSTIGLVSITAILGDALGGLGFFIYEGMTRFFATEIAVGAVPTIVLALVADRLFLWLERAITPWSRRTRTATAG